MREIYWVVKGCVVVKKVIQRYFICRQYDGKKFSYISDRTKSSYPVKIQLQGSYWSSHSSHPVTSLGQAKLIYSLASWLFLKIVQAGGHFSFFIISFSPVYELLRQYFDVPARHRAYTYKIYLFIHYKISYYFVLSYH